MADCGVERLNGFDLNSDNDGEGLKNVSTITVSATVTSVSKASEVIRCRGEFLLFLPFVLPARIPVVEISGDWSALAERPVIVVNSRYASGVVADYLNEIL